MNDIDHEKQMWLKWKKMLGNKSNLKRKIHKDIKDMDMHWEMWADGPFIPLPSVPQCATLGQHTTSTYSDWSFNGVHACNIRIDGGDHGCYPLSGKWNANIQ